jgi:hypothetical protein
MAKGKKETPASEMTNEELVAALEASQAENAKLKETVDEQADLVDELNKAVASSGKGIKKVIVKHEGTSYEVVAKSFNFEGKIVTAESLTKNAPLVATLLEMKSGHLKLVD